MPARLVQVTLINNSDFPIRWLDDQRPHGFWQEPWYPSNIGNLTKGQRGTWRLESGGVATGVEGRALFKVDVPLAANVGGRTEFINFWWERPYIGGFRRTVIHTLQDPRTSDLPHPGPALVFVVDHGFTDIANMGSSPFEFLLAVPGAPLTAYTILKNEADAKHPSWVVEVRNAGISSTIPVRQELREEVRAAVPAASSFAVCPAPGRVEVFWVRPDGMVFTNARDPKLNGGAWNNPIPIAAIRRPE